MVVATVVPDVSALKLTTKDGAVRFEVRAKPRASRSKIVGVKPDGGGALDVAIAAPPVDGAANEELVATLARALGVARSHVAIVRGEGSRAKLVEVAKGAGLTEEDVRARLGA
jgi:uncharacterized protein (TIGR00251 family)